jgi:hypothetical protein
LNVQHPLAARRQAKPTGVIETLSAGYGAINRHLWVLLLPILVDVFLSFGPHVSYSPLVDPTVTRASEWARQVAIGPRRGPRNANTNSDVVGTVEDARQFLIARTGEINILSLVARGPIALPSLGGVASANTDLSFVNDWGAGLTLLGGCLIASLVLGGGCYRGLAAASSGRGGGLLAEGRRTARDVVRVLGLIGTLLGIGLLLGVPVLLLVAFTAFVAPVVALMGALLVVAGLLLVTVHLFFAVDAIFVSNVGPLGAIQRSVGVVRQHLWPSVALIALTWVILAGMAQVWAVLASNLQSPYGIALSILGNAYIASGLIAAGMIFYTERADAVPIPGPASALTPG